VSGASGPSGAARAGDVLLAIDSATTRVVVAAGTRAGELVDAIDWPAGYRHGETLLPAIDDLLGRLAIGRDRLAAIIVGTGPGAFTGLRVGIATAKGIAQALDRPIVGIPTGEALLAGAPDDAVLLLPAGPSDRLVVRRGAPARLVAGDADAEIADGTTILALDLPGRAPEAALERGEAARAELGASLLHLGAARLAAGKADDLSRLVPDYVTLPRGVRSDAGEVSWSRDRR
jgi:tRNA threonylcarbamoyladenosine biosynthesis protein TsaB